MGQAQLLLIVLGVVLVGIAIIAGIQAYDQNNRKASVDALTHDAIRMASDLQTWAQKPAQFGGPVTYAAFDGEAGKDGGPTAPAAFGYRVDDSHGTITGGHANSNGICVMSGLAASAATITCDNTELGTQVVVSVAGLDDEDITVESFTLGS